MFNFIVRNCGDRNKIEKSGESVGRFGFVIVREGESARRSRIIIVKMEESARRLLFKIGRELELRRISGIKIVGGIESDWISRG